MRELNRRAEVEEEEDEGNVTLLLEATEPGGSEVSWER